MSEDPKNTYALTEVHFRKFIAYCKEWIDVFGMFDWKVEYQFSDKAEFDHMDGNRAVISMNLSGMVATAYLNKEWETCEPTDKELRRCALHEVVGELILRPLERLGECRFNVDEGDMEYERHRIIRRLEHVCMKYIPTKLEA